MGNVVDIQANNLLAYMVEDELPLKQQSIVSLFWHPKTQGLWRLSISKRCSRTPAKSSNNRKQLLLNGGSGDLLDLSCSQHGPFWLEIHKSFDCYSLPDMSFQSDPLKAIPWPGFVIYISTTVCSPDFWGDFKRRSVLPLLTSTCLQRWRHIRSLSNRMCALNYT